MINWKIIDGEFIEFTSNIIGIISSDNTFKCLEINQNKLSNELTICINSIYELKLKCSEKDKFRFFHFSNNNPYRLIIVLQNQINYIAIDKNTLQPIEYKEIPISIIQDIRFYNYYENCNITKV